MRSRILFILCFISVVAGNTIEIPGDYSTIQAGIDAASDGDTVLVSPGTYVENINYGGKNIVVIGEDMETTIIDGNQSGSVVTITGGEDTTAVLNGFTIQNGSADYGGGIYIHGAGPTLKYLIIRNNLAGDSPQGGGGIGIEGIYEQTDKLTKIFNCLFYDNQAGRGQAIKSQDYTGLQIIQSTFFNNTVVDSFSNFYEYIINGSNNIFWGNDSILRGSSNFNFSYSNIQGGWEGEGNIDADPLFCDAENGDYTLAENSPCIDAGDPSSPYDPDGTIADMGAFGIGCEAILSTDKDVIPLQYVLHQNYPNPFNPTTQIKYDLPEDAMVNVTIYDMMGRLVSNLVSSQQNAGYKSLQWNATNDAGSPVSAGLYLYTIQAGEFRQTKKMVLLK